MQQFPCNKKTKKDQESKEKKSKRVNKFTGKEITRLMQFKNY